MSGFLDDVVDFFVDRLGNVIEWVSNKWLWILFLPLVLLGVWML